MKPIESMWKKYADLVIPKASSEEAVAQHKKSFYAGCATVYFLLTSTVDDDKVFRATLDQMHSEIWDRLGKEIAKDETVR